MARVLRRQRERLNGPRDHRPLPAQEVGADPAAAPRPGAGRLGHRGRHGAHRRAASRSPRPRCSARQLLRDVQAPPGGRYLVNICTNISCMLLGAEELVAPRRGAPRHPPGRHHRRRHVHPRGRGVHRRVHRGAVPAGQLPLLREPGHPRRLDQLLDDLAGRAPAPTRSPTTARSARVRQQIPADRAAGRRPEAPPTARGRATAEAPDEDDREGPHVPRRPGPSPGGAPPRSSPPPASSDEDSHTLERYLRPPAATRACAPRWMTPAAVHDEVKAASLLGRGGAGFPAGVKWGFCPPDVWPRYLVVNGDESEPGTYKDRLLMERDPHQLIEGVPHRLLRRGLRQAFLYVRGEMALAQERIAAGPQRGLRRRVRRQATSSAPTSRSTSCCTGVPAPTSWARRPRSSRASRATGACPGSSRRTSPRPRASTASPPSSTTSRRCPTCRGSSATAARPTPRSARELAGHPHVRGVGPRQEAPASTRSSSAHHLPRPHLRPGVRGGGIRDGHELKAFIPGGASAPWFFEEHLDLPLEKGAVARPARCSARAPSSSWTTPPTSVKACLRVVRFFARESCGKCTPCREGTTWLEKILRASSTATAARATSSCCSTSATTSAPGPSPTPPTGIAWPPFP
jgi:NADH-quinone oxidoreductase subunit F